MIPRLNRVLDDHYWTARWIVVCTISFVLSIWLGGVR